MKNLTPWQVFAIALALSSLSIIVVVFLEFYFARCHDIAIGKLCEELPTWLEYWR